jgi:hypothetical protein
VDPAPVQALFTQQPPPEQALPGQHAFPGAPHGTQVPAPLPLHTVALALQVRLAQQGWPLPPQARQIPPLHTDELARQVSPAQQASPRAPQASGASAPPPSTVAVRVAVEVAVAVPVVVEVGVSVAVAVAVAVVVVVAVAVLVGVEVTGVSGRPASVTIGGASERPASVTAASRLFPSPSPAQATNTQVSAHDVSLVLRIRKRPGNATSVRGLLIGILPLG